MIPQCVITLPWRIYTYKVSKGVLAALHCAEVLQFQASYKADALRTLLPDTVRKSGVGGVEVWLTFAALPTSQGLMHSVDLAHECDVSTIARLYCASFSTLFEQIGLPPGAGPAVIEKHWRSRGDVTLAR